jgi:hypothetical protein
MKMTGNQKLTRDTQTRELSERPKAWRPPELLPEPDKQAGFAYRWVAVSVNGQYDHRNFTSKVREGWEPVRIEEQPKFQMLVDPNSRFKDNIEIGGLLLCKIPEEFVSQRAEHYANATQAQTEGVDNNLMRQSDARMPIFKEGKSTSSFGRGS